MKGETVERGKESAQEREIAKEKSPGVEKQTYPEARKDAFGFHAHEKT